MWTYSTDAVALQAFEAPSMQAVSGVTINGVHYSDKYIFNDERPVIDNGHLSLAGIEVDGKFSRPQTVVLDGDTLIAGGHPVSVNGIEKISVEQGVLANSGQILNIDGTEVAVGTHAVIVSELSLLQPGTKLTLAHIASKDENTGEYVLEQTSDLPAVNSPKEIGLEYSTLLNPATPQYQNAGDWNGILLAIQGIAAVLWAVVLASFRHRRTAYSVSLLIGAVGFMSVFFIHNQYILFISYALMGCAWAAMLSMPFTILTNALSGGNIGTYLGLFNCTITIPQIVAALCGGMILHCFPAASNGAPLTVGMLFVSGILLLLGAICVWFIKETFGSQTTAAKA